MSVYDCVCECLHTDEHTSVYSVQNKASVPMASYTQIDGLSDTIIDYIYLKLLSLTFPATCHDLNIT